MATRATTTIDSSPKRILATDDRPEVLRLVDRTLGEHYELEFAASVAEAREKLGGGRFDLAMCDIQMPGESGLVLAEEIAHDRPETAVVLVTGVDDPEIAAKALEFGASGYLVKPFWPGQLLITAMNALRRHELEAAHEAHSRTLEERLQMLMDAAPVPIYIKDSRRRYAIANRVAHEIAGLKPNELVGRSDSEFMSPETERVAAASDHRILDEGETYEAEETMTVGRGRENLPHGQVPVRRRPGEDRRDHGDLDRTLPRRSRPKSCRSGWRPPRGRPSRSCGKRGRKPSTG